MVLPVYADISIHAPREGGDLIGRPRLHGRGGISIHAPREGGDASRSFFVRPSLDFNPRPPRGGRQFERTYSDAMWQFQSTPPARGATLQKCGRTIDSLFQSTPPARGATPTGRIIHNTRHNFNPRPPRGGRPILSHLRLLMPDISIHAPREGGDTVLQSPPR